MSATFFPGGSETYLYYLLGKNENIFLLIFVATGGNTLGSLFNYSLGRWGRRFLLSRIFGFTRISLRKARRRFKKWGALMLFLSFLPIIGDPVTAIAGLMTYPVRNFLFWVYLGKLVRYSLVAVIFIWTRN